MATNKTTETHISVSDFINSIKDEIKRKDSFSLIEIIKNQTNLEPKMWGPNIVGFGSYHYKYESGREGESPIIGFSPRASAISLYFSSNLVERDILLKNLGKHTAGKGCIYIKTLYDIDVKILQKMVANQFKQFKNLSP